MQSEKTIEVLSLFVGGFLAAYNAAREAETEPVWEVSEPPVQAEDEPKPSARPRGRPKALPRSRSYLRAFANNHLTRQWEPLRAIAARADATDKRWVAGMLKDSVKAGLVLADGNGGGRRYRRG